MSKPAPTFTDAELRRMRVAIEQSTDLTLEQIARRFRCSHHTIMRLAAEGGWQLEHRRGKARKQMEARAAANAGGTI